MLIEIDTIMARLAQRRPLFCSEADFQHELAYDLRRSDPDVNVRLEYPLGPGLRGAIDILLFGAHRHALELKYLCKGLKTKVGDEDMILRHQGAHDIRRYDVCKDVERMEKYAHRTGHGAAVLVLSNDPAYWQPRRRADTVDAAFDLSDLRQLSGVLGWGTAAGAGTTKGRESALEIRGNYPLAWRDYSDLGGAGGRFRYLWVPVAAPKNI